ncbi:MAG: dihydropteroate synthase [Pseudomonadales bacterium]|nr:dihydropteroate synthase [Pseudomonadales bacterium]
MGSLSCGSRVLSLAEPGIMGILNLTPDSFSDGGRFWRGGVDVPRIVDAARAMLAAGAAIIDVGGESTRPGADPVDEAEECRRVLPVVAALAELDAVISVDTRKAGVARRAAAAGAHLVNDVSGLRDPAMIEALAATGLAGCIMHMQGEPRTMQAAPIYVDVVQEVRDFFADRVAACRAAGIAPDRLLLDPGFGFGKTLEHNLALLRRLEALRVEGLPLLVGLSRKRMIGALTGRAIGDRMAGSVVAAVLAVERGANLVRVHDVTETADALRLLQAVEGSREAVH